MWLNCTHAARCEDSGYDEKICNACTQYYGVRFSTCAENILHSCA